MRFWNGAIRLTQCKSPNLESHPWNPDQFMSFEQCICPESNSQISKCIISSYCTDMEWLFGSQSFFRSILTPNAKIVMMAHGEQDSRHISIGHESRSSINIQLVFPFKMRNIRKGYGTMHTKLLIFEYTDGTLRIVIMSANLVEFDFNEVQNILFIQDFPTSIEETGRIPFKSDLLECLGDHGIDIDFIDLSKYDFTASSVRLITSVPIVGCSGISRLQKVVSEEMFGIDVKDVEYQCSSIGKIDHSWINSFILGSSGKSANTEQAKVKIVFPSIRTVKSSKIPTSAFGTIFSGRKGDISTDSAQLCTCESVIRKENQAMHSKIMTVKSEDECYIVFGSHNFTQAAWGRAYSGKRRRLENPDDVNVADLNSFIPSNFELSVWIKESAAIEMCVDKTFPYPYKIPAEPYRVTDAPWSAHMLH